ncbi:MAG: ATP-binding protein [Kiritimatiellae bacterium]|nr:ATP-binding protein [Kiritimatiellia bacterium]
MTIRRDLYLNKLISAKHDGFVKIITGIRRCGKSFLLTKLFRRHLVASGVSSSRIIVLDLDDDKNEFLRNPRRLSEWVRRRIRSKSVRYYLFIDEIQMCEEVRIDVEGAETKLTFYDVLNGLLKYPKLDIYVTGSNSKMLSSDIATNFRDRGEEIRLHPLSFAEFRQVVKKDEYSAFREYLVYGGMPLCVLKRTESDKRAYLKALFEKVYLKDVVERNKIRDKSVLECVLDMLSSAVGSLTNANKLAQQLNSQQGLKTNSPTVTRQIGYLRDAYLFSKVDRYDVHGKRYLNYPSKFYSEDIGLRNVRLNFREFEDAHLMENVIYNELVARGYAVDVGVVEVDVKEDGKVTRKQLEIDFVVNTGFNKIYIQSAYALPDQAKRDQETLSLRKSGDFFKKIVVTAANAPAFEGQDGITYIGIIPFLLDRTFLESAVCSATNAPGAFPA